MSQSVVQSPDRPSWRERANKDAVLIFCVVILVLTVPAIIFLPTLVGPMLVVFIPTVVAMLLIRHGWRACPELDRLPTALPEHSSARAVIQVAGRHTASHAKPSAALRYACAMTSRGPAVAPGRPANFDPGPSTAGYQRIRPLMSDQAGARSEPGRFQIIGE